MHLPVTEWRPEELRVIQQNNLFLVQTRRPDGEWVTQKEHRTRPEAEMDAFTWYPYPSKESSYPIPVVTMLFKTALAEANEDHEALVFYGCGGDLTNWIEGISELFKRSGASQTDDPAELFHSVGRVTTTGGRVDLAFFFKDESVNLSRLAVARFTFPQCSWLSDYVVNYANQHTL